MTKVMASGVFDILHLGHVYFLEEAKKLGGRLAVVVACDATVRKLKHEPITPENMRLEMVKVLKPVDEAYIGYEGDPYKIVAEIKPDIIAIGYDQQHDIEKIEKELTARNLKIKVVRLPKHQDAFDLNGTRKIVGKIIEAYEFQKKIENIEACEKNEKREATK